MLSGKKIVITGVASGIGKETAKVCKELGAEVIGLDRNPAEGVDHFIQVDLSNEDSINAAVAKIIYGIDGIANIAGLPPTAPADVVVSVNLVGLKKLTYALLPKLNDNGSIVNLASLAGLGWRDAVDSIKAAENLDFEDVSAFNKAHEVVGPRSYFFSKEALIVWTFKNRWTWRDRGIRMNCVSPGPVETPILKDFLETLGERAEEDMRIMDRPGHPTDVAPVVAFMLSDNSKWIRGANIPVDGGMNQHVLTQMHGL